MKHLSPKEKAYLAGFLDGDGSVYVKLKKHEDYRFKYQISSYITFYQNKSYFKFLEMLQRQMGFGYIRRRKDGIDELTIGDEKSQLSLIENLLPYSHLKKQQLRLMRDILLKKKEVTSAADFLKVCKLVDRYETLNYSKKRIQTSSEVKKRLIAEGLLTP